MRFKGTRYLTVERANAAWALGQTITKRVQLGRLKGWERKSALCEARENVKAGIRGLGKRGLVRSAAAAQTDLAAIQALLDPFKVVDELEWVPAKGKEEGRSFDLSRLKDAAIEAAGGLLSPDQIQLIWQKLRELRHAIVEAGAPRPIIIYEAQ